MNATARLRTTVFVFAVLCGFATVTPAVQGQTTIDRKSIAAAQQQQASQRAMIAKLMDGGGTNSAQAEGDMLDDASGTPLKTAAAAQPGPKKPGVVRIGIVLPANQMTGQGDLKDGEPVRDAEIKLLTGPTIEAVKLTAINPAQAREEALRLDCDYVLSSTLTQQESAPTGRFGKFANMHMVHMATTAAQFIPGVQATAMMANLLTSEVMQQGLISASRGVKANSDVTLTYTLTGRNGNVTLQDTEKAHSKSGGENVLTPMLTAAATKVVTAVGK